MLHILSSRTNHDMMDLMAESVAQHQATLDINAPRDFTDAMLIEIQKTTDRESSFYGEFGIENLKNVLFDLFLAGSETTSTTLTWAVLYMVRYPRVQARVQEELDAVVGQNRRPAIADRANLPYTEVTAVVCPIYIIILSYYSGCSNGGPEIRQYCSKWCPAHFKCRHFG